VFKIVELLCSKLWNYFVQNSGTTVLEISEPIVFKKWNYCVQYNGTTVLKYNGTTLLQILELLC
jgi:hypothetical protein